MQRWGYNVIREQQKYTAHKKMLMLLSSYTVQTLQRDMYSSVQTIQKDTPAQQCTNFYKHGRLPSFPQSFRRTLCTSEINASISCGVPKKWIYCNLRWKISQIHLASEYIKSYSRPWESDEVASQCVSRPLPTNSLNLWKYGEASHLKTHSTKYTQLKIQKYIPSNLFSGTSDIQYWILPLGFEFGMNKNHIQF